MADTYTPYPLNFKHLTPKRIEVIFNIFNNYVYLIFKVSKLPYSVNLNYGVFRCLRLPFLTACSATGSGLSQKPFLTVGLTFFSDVNSL